MLMMQFDDSLISAPVLEDAIDRQPLMVPPETSVMDAIALMSQARGSSCMLAHGDRSPTLEAKTKSCCSCVLVMREAQLLGIFTERDIVRLAATGIDLATVTVTDVMAHPPITLPQATFQDIFAALFLFRRYRIRHLPIVDDGDRVVGIVSPESIRQVLRPANLLKLRRVADVMATQIVHSPLSASVLSLAKLMAARRVSCVVITEQDGDRSLVPVGIVTERDIVQFQTLQLDLAQVQAQTVMSTPLFLLKPEDSLWTAHCEMQQRHVRRLVVSWNWGNRLGIVTQTSLLRVFDPMEMYGVVETLQRTVHQLQTEKNTQLSATNPFLASQNLDDSAPPDTATAKDCIKLSDRLLVEPDPLAAALSGGSEIEIMTAQRLNTLFATLKMSLESAIADPTPPVDVVQGKIRQTLGHLDQLRSLIQQALKDCVEQR